MKGDLVGQVDVWGEVKNGEESGGGSSPEL